MPLSVNKQWVTDKLGDWLSFLGSRLQGAGQGWGLRPEAWLGSSHLQAHSSLTWVLAGLRSSLAIYWRPKFFVAIQITGASLIAQLVKSLPAMQETRVWFLVWKDPLEKEMATHSILAWRIPWTEYPDRLQSMGLQKSDTTDRLNHHRHSHHSSSLPMGVGERLEKERKREREIEMHSLSWEEDSKLVWILRGGELWLRATVEVACTMRYAFMHFVK